MNNIVPHYDVVIVGGGMVGATLACALDNSGMRVALIEANKPVKKWPKTGFDVRVSALTLATQHIFETLGLWDAIEDRRVSPFREMHVWDSSGGGRIHFDSAELGEPQLGHIVENRVIVAALYEKLRTLKHTDLLCPLRLQSMMLNHDDVQLTTAHGQTISGSLVVGADGGRSWVRQQAHISVRGWDYEQEAVVTYVKTERDHQQTAWQRFLPEGPLAFLPLTDGFSSIVWSTSPVHARELLAMDDAGFATELAAAFEHRLGEVQSVGPRASYPLRFFDADHYVRPHLALVGDAAHTMHPLAGQGVNLGLADVASLAEVLTEAYRDGGRLGAMGTLRRYERWRKSENLAMLATVDGFHRLFGSQLRVVRWLRGSGMNLTYRLTPVKNSIMRHAMGLEGDLPKLSRGLTL